MYSKMNQQAEENDEHRMIMRLPPETPLPITGHTYPCHKYIIVASNMYSE
jgi:hypothetical protein